MTLTLIVARCRITCTNMTAGGKRNTVLSTRGGANLRDNFTLVFGMKSVCARFDASSLNWKFRYDLPENATRKRKKGTIIAPTWLVVTSSMFVSVNRMIS